MASIPRTSLTRLYDAPLQHVMKFLGPNEQSLIIITNSSFKKAIDDATQANINALKRSEPCKHFFAKILKSEIPNRLKIHRIYKLTLTEMIISDHTIGALGGWFEIFVDIEKLLSKYIDIIIARFSSEIPELRPIYDEYKKRKYPLEKIRDILILKILEELGDQRESFSKMFKEAMILAKIELARTLGKRFAYVKLFYDEIMKKNLSDKATADALDKAFAKWQKENLDIACESLGIARTKDFIERDDIKKILCAIALSRAIPELKPICRNIFAKALLDEETAKALDEAITKWQEENPDIVEKIISLNLNNEIRILPKYFSGFTGLKVLIINKCHLSDISYLKNLPNLEHLDLNNNNVSDISPLEELSELQVLHIKDNLITKLDSLESLEKLQQLDVRENYLLDLPEFFLLKKFISLKINETSFDKSSQIYRDLEKP